MIPSQFSFADWWNICESRLTISYVDAQAATELLPGFGKGFFLYFFHLKINQWNSKWKEDTFSKVSRFHIALLQAMKE